MGNPPTRCLDAEVLAAYLDHGVSLAERARVEAHLASCPQCLALVAGVARTVAALPADRTGVVSAAASTSLLTRRTLARSVAAAAAVIALAVAPSFVRSLRDRDMGLVSLADTVAESRPVLGRLTGGFPHAPLGGPSAGGQGGQADEHRRVLLTAGKIHESFGERLTPSRLHAAGLAQLLSGQANEAVDALAAAVREQPANASYLNDLAVAQLERARLGVRPDDLPRALASATRAARLDPASTEARFNLALALSALSLRDQATTAWSDYLAHDSTSAWAAEARAQLDTLRRPTPAQAWASMSPQFDMTVDLATAEAAVRIQGSESRAYLETHVIADWASAALTGAAPMPLNLRTWAEAVLRVTGDAFYVDIVEHIEHAPVEQARLIAQAIAAYAHAASLYNNDRYADAIPLLRQAVAGLDAVRSPYAERARIDLASLDYLTGRYDAVTADLTAILARAQQHGYGFIEARANWLLGLGAFMQGRHGEARAYYEATLARFEAMQDAEQVAAAHNLLAGLFVYLGSNDNAWAHLVPAMHGLDITTSKRLRHGLLSTASMAMGGIDAEAALAIQDAALLNATSWGQQPAIAEAYAQRASLLARLGRHSEAEASLSEASRHADATVDEAFKPRVQTTVLSIEAELWRRSNPTAAIRAAEQAIALASSRRDRMRVAQLEWRLAQAHLALGHTTDAQRALERGIASFQADRDAMTDEGRLSSRNEAWGLFDTALQLAIRGGHLEQAFELAEQSRMRTLAESRAGHTPVPLSQVRASLDADEAVVEVNQFDDELAVWVIRRDAVSVRTRPITRLDAERLIARQQDEITQQAAPGASRQLYNEILRPLSAQLEGATRLIWVPDQTFVRLAVPALWDERTRQFLVETMSVRQVTAAAAMIRSRAARPSFADGALVVGSDAGDTDAESIAALYREPTILVGANATKTRLLESVAKHGVVHLAAAVSPSAVNPLLARMALTDERNKQYSGIVAGTDIAKQPLSSSQIVVVEGLGTTSTHRGEGTLDIARAFITAGVTAAVGMLPGADERATRDLMIGFHREIAAGVSAEQALQQVQRNAIQQNGRRFGAWSALVLYGSDR